MHVSFSTTRHRLERRSFVSSNPIAGGEVEVNDSLLKVAYWCAMWERGGLEKADLSSCERCREKSWENLEAPTKTNVVRWLYHVLKLTWKIGKVIFLGKRPPHPGFYHKYMRSRKRPAYVWSAVWVQLFYWIR